MTATFHNSVVDAMHVAFGTPRAFGPWRLMDSDELEAEFSRVPTEAVGGISLGANRLWTFARSPDNLNIYLMTDIPYPVDGSRAPHDSVYVLDAAESLRSLADHLAPDTLETEGETGIAAPPHPDDKINMNFTHGELSALLQAADTATYGSGFNGDPSALRSATDDIEAAIGGG